MCALAFTCERPEAIELERLPPGCPDLAAMRRCKPCIVIYYMITESGAVFTASSDRYKPFYADLSDPRLGRPTTAYKTSHTP